MLEGSSIKKELVRACTVVFTMLTLVGGMSYHFDKVNTLSGTIVELEEKYIIEASHHESTMVSLAEATVKNETAELQIESLTEEKKSLEKENGELKEKNASLEGNIQRLEKELARRKAEIEAEEKAKAKTRQKQSQVAKPLARASSVNESSSNVKSTRTMQITAYTTNEPGVTGITASGKQVQFGMIAMGRSWPFGTRVRIHAPGIPEIDGKIFVNEDRGGKISDNHIDIYVGDLNLARQIGRRNVTVEILS